MLTDSQAIFGEIFHTALRKSLDSTASSICWNAVYLLDKKDWEDFLKAVSSADPLTRQACEDAIYCGNAARNLFRIGLKMLTDEEYEVLDKRVKERM